MFTKGILLKKSSFNETPAFGKKDGLWNGEFSNHGSFEKTRTF